MTMEAQDKTRVNVRYEGSVQGVGFRYTVMHIARDFEVTGYVQNMFDGSVHLVSEGKEAVILEFLGRIKSSHLGRYIVKDQANWSKAQGEFRNFDVKYG